MGRNVKSFKYVGTECETMEHGEYYTYADIVKINGMKLTSARNRMRTSWVDGENVITDEILRPTVNAPFFSIKGDKIVPPKRVFCDRLETDSEKMMDKYLRRAL